MINQGDELILFGAARKYMKVVVSKVDSEWAYTENGTRFKKEVFEDSEGFEYAMFLKNRAYRNRPDFIEKYNRQVLEERYEENIKTLYAKKVWSLPDSDVLEMIKLTEELLEFVKRK